MRYVLDRDVALRSWERIPWACYRWGDPIPRRLERDAFELLALCDGEHDLEPSPLLGKLVSANMAHPAAPGETWDAWSAPCSYGNRLFHSLNWAVTGRCNYRCRHCFMADGSGPMLGQFSWEECVSLLDECERCGIQTVTLTGGEPMLHPDFTDIVRECARRRICVGEINTNGSLLTPAMLDELRRLGMDPEIKVSASTGWATMTGCAGSPVRRATPSTPCASLTGGVSGSGRRPTSIAATSTPCPRPSSSSTRWASRRCA